VQIAIDISASNDKLGSLKYAVVIEKTPTGFSGHVPDISGVGVAGETRAKIRRLLREAVAIYIAEKRAKGTRAPRSTTVAEYVDAA
jgi:predicted RNase H-like HicB family nuclease